MSLARGGAENQLVNYRHAFHAGSFADVFKHAVLCRILHYLRGKPAAFPYARVSVCSNERG